MTLPPPYEPPPAYGPVPPDGGVPQPTAAEYPYPSYPAHPPYPPYPHLAPPRTNALAIAALVSAFLCTPLAIVFGHVSLAQIKRSGEQGRGLAIAGLVISYLLTAAVIAMLLFGLLLVQTAREAFPSGIPGYQAAPSAARRSLPDFAPPAGLGSSCSYPATPASAAKPVKPPRSGKVATAPALINAAGWTLH